MNINASALDASAISKYSHAASEQGGTVDFFLNIIPHTFMGAFSNGVMLQVILISVLMGVALVQMGETSKPLIRSEEHTSELQSLMRISYAVFCLKKKNSNLY